MDKNMAEPFFMENRKLYGQGDKYILMRSDTEEEKNQVLLAITYFVQRKVTVTGIASEDTNLVGKKICNREIASLKDIDRSVTIFNSTLFPLKNSLDLYNIRNINCDI